MNKKVLCVIFLAALILPATTLASIDSIQSLMSTFVNDVVWVVFGGIVIICFIYSGILFLTSGGQPDKLQRARASFLWGIAGVAVGIIAFSIIAILTKALS